MVYQWFINNSLTIRQSFVHSLSILVSKKVVKNDVIIRKKYIFMDLSKLNDILTNYSSDY